MSRFDSFYFVFKKIGKYLRSRVFCKLRLDSIRVFIKKNRHSEAKNPNPHYQMDSSVITFLQNDRIKTAMHTGWSMIEMLGVLAIIGVLSIAGMLVAMER